MARARLPELQRLLDMRVQASQAKLREITDRDAQLAQLLTDLTAQKTAKGENASGRDSIMAMQLDLQHLKWIDQRRATINTERAQVRALTEMARADLKQHFSRQQALDSVARKLAKSAKQTLQRRRDYGS